MHAFCFDVRKSRNQPHGSPCISPPSHQTGRVNHLRDDGHLPLLRQQLLLRVIDVRVERPGQDRGDGGPDRLALPVEVVLGHVRQLGTLVQGEAGLLMVGGKG